MLFLACVWKGLRKCLNVPSKSQTHQHMSCFLFETEHRRLRQQAHVRRQASVLLRQENSDHDMQERTTSLCCERRVVVEHVDPLWPTSAHRFLVARNTCTGKRFGVQQTVPLSFSSTPRSSPSQEFATCSCARPGNRLLENDHDQSMRKALRNQSRNHLMRKRTFRKLPKGKRQVPPLHLPRRAGVAEPWRNWQSDSEASIKAPVHWPVVCRNETSPVRHIRV